MIATGVGRERLGRVEKTIIVGHVCPPIDMRKLRGSNATQEAHSLTAYSFFSYVYQVLAEPMADEERITWTPNKAGVGQGLSEWALANRGNPVAVASGGGIDRRMLPHMGMTDFYIL